MERPDRAPATARSSASKSPLSPLRLAALGLALAAVALVMWGGYGHRWPWTGINGNTATLWDWLHLLMLPIAFGLLPVLLSKETRLRSGHRWALSAVLVGFGLFVLAGYVIPWSWTGFPGNKLWDWLELLALPVAITLIPVMDEIRLSWTPRDTALAAAGLAVFAGIVIGGYVGHWAWTGFTGNTLWDWLHLLLLPLLLPTVIVPRLVPRMKATLIVVEEDEPAQDEPAQAGPAEPQSSEPEEPADTGSLDHIE